MKASNIAAYFLFAGVAAASFWRTTYLLRRHSGRALRLYRLALAGFLGSAILGIIGNYILQEMLFLQGSPGTAHVSAAWVFSLLALPLNILALDAFAGSFRAWAGKRYPPAWRIAYFVLQAAFVAAFIAFGPGLYEDAFASRADLGAVFVKTLDAANRLYPAFLAAAFAFIWGRKPSAPAPKGVRAFAFLYAGLFLAGFILLLVIPPGQGQRAFRSAFAFLIHPAPIFLLGRALGRSARDRPPEAADGQPAEAVLAGFGVSKREAEIVRLLADGKSYREIEAELFISLKTVKTHVYNIYRKTGVKSRWQLMALLRGERKEDREPGSEPESGPGS